MDPVTDCVAFAEEAARDARAEFRVAAAEALPFANAKFDASLGLLILQDLGDGSQAM